MVQGKNGVFVLALCWLPCKINLVSSDSVFYKTGTEALVQTFRSLVNPNVLVDYKLLSDGSPGHIHTIN